MKKLLLSSVILWIAIALFSCKGDTGAAGPAGPAGANGAANINWAIYNNVSWNDVSGGNGTDWEADLIDPSVTSGILNSCVVAVYISSNSGSTWVALPQPYNSYNWNYFYVVGTVTIDLTNNSESAITAPTGIDAKVIVIPPTEMAKMKLHNVNLKDYNQVNAYIKLNSK